MAEVKVLFYLFLVASFSKLYVFLRVGLQRVLLSVVPDGLPLNFISKCCTISEGMV